MLDKKSIQSLREKHLAPSLSLSYGKTLHIVKGKGQYLYDADGCQYLDAVNNIQHVGHCHPKVVSAAQLQYEKLNTNTRYLDETIVNYAQKLTDKLPAGLDVCFFTNSGSEANDLALRIARHVTQSKETIVLDAAYHGNLSSLIEISP
ncbi:MAG: aminotransferase class III-fold pyridoxal phosphate-dependent enzyme, partial [Candidatus Marinimicrobia bacterium]|nr:aminotransferase class III-fold pyridoxal phosphate-dependent enzyme [Candidatus Neomarinimicrobiota bacterium]MBT5114463.1 aminotransferase class III-fold pyridoxal phosphate-dependent enzyme [Candidatus Neomarinimicrobiota bacterium]MBT5748551.1 aminotransferase class III-fold pyridoxal phosphate-dependent enzyme [Candidatus Neomarinimicrobiota bacterium]MBT6797007.1 aminotransferase class III-fold pyridoxal phosphate-dependent enzyme [Candidatus Neomarinimicrobiota bacterium]MBT6865962.1 